MNDKGLGEVFPEYDWRRVLLAQYELAQEQYRTYLQMRFNNKPGLRIYDYFLSILAGIYGDIRPKLIAASEGESFKLAGKTDSKEIDLPTMIVTMDHLRANGRRLKPAVAIEIFNIIGLFFEHWGLTKVEMQNKRHPGRSL